ncbi:glycoside hydrolase family 113 [Ekhidna sp.]|uniref:glycoside hydrolase family 113 n=1 Tax=Ekhidna sp. TaxID=2608089 RepID=UPI003CCBD791
MRLFVIFLFLSLGVAAMVLLPAGKEPMINGVSLVNPPRKITPEKMGEVKRINAGWVAVIPYGFSRAGEPAVTFDHERQWWGEQTDGTCTLIEYAKAHQLKVMLKPHVWVRGEGWTGDFNLSSEEQWKKWEQDFSAYILNHATVADSMNVEILCIGTEYRIPAKERPEFWRRLIVDVRKIYNGKLTYAANWDNYENISWWDAVDYIGIDAYFPLADGNHPTINEIESGWEPIKNDLASFAEKWDKKILFTEYGFQSANGAAGKHWETDKSEENANHQLQADAYEATYMALTSEDWFAGGFLWKWHFTSRHGHWRGTEWTPQHKPAEKVIAKWYDKMH